MVTQRIADAPPPYAGVVFDCDSTLSAIEGIDELAVRHKAQIAELTDRAMRGELRLEEVYGRRLALVRPSRAELLRVGALYVERALPHARELVSALRASHKRVAIVSGGLLPAVLAIARAIGVDDEDVFAVDVRFDAGGGYAGYDEASPLAKSGGKCEIVRRIAARSRPLALVGDGMTDLEAAGECARFVAFGGVVRRAPVFELAAVTCSVPDLAALVPLVFSAPEVDILARASEHAPLVAPYTRQPGR
ncbi:MAG: HAD-IB family phosphatase [Planctomycetota bacterium]